MDLSQIKSLQKLNISLYFSDELYDRMLENAEEIAEEFDVEVRHLKVLPDVRSENFQVERFGRKIMVVREIYHRFKLFFQSLILEGEGRDVRPDEILNSSIMREFLGSEYFLTPNFSLPHPYGTGEGYDNISKFFFFATDRGRLSARLADTLRTEFSIHLINWCNHARDEFFNRVRSGVFFLKAEDQQLRLITDSLKVVDLKQIQAREPLFNKGFLNLDKLKPTRKGETL